MKEVEANGQKILLVRLDDRFYAVSANCPHYGVSLAEGVLCGDRVVCPWHKSVFRITDGELLEPPSLDALSRYEVTVHAERVLVRLSDSPPQPAAAEVTDNRTFVIAGAGAAGTAAAEHLRKLGCSGRIVMVSSESELPYDRTKLSKEFLSGNAETNELPLRPPAFWDTRQIDRHTAHILTVNMQQHDVILSDGTTLKYDRLLLATGSVARQLNVPGRDLGEIQTLRSQADAVRIAASARPGVRIVVIGGSFIALEAASCFALRKLPVTVVVNGEAPLAKQLGPEVGRILQNWHADHGVEFRLHSQVERFEGTGVVRQVVLQSGESIPADLVIVGIGVTPATDFAARLARREDGGIIADRHLQASQDVYVAGDLAVVGDTRIEHWRVAQQHGRTAAGNMLGAEKAFDGIPYFWTNHFGTRFDYVGHAEDWDEVILQQADELPQFLAYYIKGTRVVAASACRRDRDIAALHELLRLDRVPSPEQIRAGVDWAALR